MKSTGHFFASPEFERSSALIEHHAEAVEVFAADFVAPSHQFRLTRSIDRIHDDQIRAEVGFIRKSDDVFEGFHAARRAVDEDVGAVQFFFQFRMVFEVVNVDDAVRPFAEFFDRFFAAGKEFIVEVENRQFTTPSRAA